MAMDCYLGDSRPWPAVQWWAVHHWAGAVAFVAFLLLLGSWWPAIEEAKPVEAKTGAKHWSTERPGELAACASRG